MLNSLHVFCEFSVVVFHMKCHRAPETSKRTGRNNTKSREDLHLSEWTATDSLGHLNVGDRNDPGVQAFTMNNEYIVFSSEM